MNRNRSYTNNIVTYLKVHQASLGSLLLLYGVFFLAAIIMSGWTPLAFSQDVFDYPSSTMPALMPRSYISIIFFVTSLSSLLIGIILLCTYTMNVLRFGITFDSEHVAILLTTIGFAYQVVGAWPLGNPADFQWEWQKQIMSYGPFFVWLFYLLSLVVLGLGAVSLYVHSKKNRHDCTHFLFFNE